MASYKVDVERLADCRKKLGLKKYQAATLVGVSQPTYVRYEQGIRQPSMQILREMAVALGTSADYLLGKGRSSKPDTYVITKKDDSDMFKIVESCKKMTESQLKRALAYCQKMTEKK